MIEVRIPLSLPIRKVVLAERGAAVPEWLRAEFARHPESLTERNYGGHTTPTSTTPATPQLHQSLALERKALGAERAAVAAERQALQRDRANFTRGLTALQQAASRSDEQLQSLIGEVREATIELAHAIAAKLIFEQIDRDRFPIANLVHEVLARLQTRDAAVVRLHPADLALLEVIPTIATPRDERSLQYLADSTLARGDCRATAGEIKVVYELRHQIEEIRRQLLSTVSGHDEIGP